MNVRTIQTEEPRVEQWRLLSRFSYDPNISRFLTSRGTTVPTPSLTEYVAGCIRQAHAYFVASTGAPLDIQPLLLYYGVTNLLAGTGAMLAGQRLPVDSHGMALRRPPGGGNRIADLEIVPSTATGSGLNQFMKVFARSAGLYGGVPWTVGEIFGSVPDLKESFRECFPTGATFTLPVEVLRREGLVIERIALTEFTGGRDVVETLRRVPGFGESYIRPALPGGDYVILRRKVGAVELGSHSLGGSKWLHIAHEKQGHLVEPGQVILMLMGLFALGHLSRYFPEQWNPFVRADATGERILVERFLEIALRFIPNLVLNALFDERIQFVYPVSDSDRAKAPLTGDEIKSIVHQEVDDAIRKQTV